MLFKGVKIINIMISFFKPRVRLIRFFAMKLIFASLFFFILDCSSLFACSVPVFRYALERWPADPYVVSVFHRGELNDKEKKVVEYYKKFYADRETIIFSIFDLDSNELSVKTKEYWESHKQNKLPTVLLRYPLNSKMNKLAGVHSLDMKSAKQIMESPAGRDVARRILKNDSAVFVQIDCDNELENKKHEEIVKGALKEAEETFKLPHEDLDEEEELDEESMEYDKATLEIKFSLLRVSRKNPADKVFIDILLDSEDGLRDLTTPLIFPIFGRGRALLPFTGKGINKENMLNVASFITGSCSCEIKALNPGFDMLVPVKWDDFINNKVNLDEELPALTVPLSLQEREISKTIDKENSTSKDSVSGLSALSFFVIIGAIAALLLGVGSWLILRRNRQ